MFTLDLARAHIHQLRREADDSRRGRLPIERRLFRRGTGR